MTIVGIISLALLSVPPEDWTKQSRFEDEENFYYVGISSPSNDEKISHEEAFQMAVKSLVLEHFGREMRIQERVFEDLDGISANQQLEFSDSNLKLRGLKLISEKWTETGKMRVLRILIAYPKQERVLELKRQLRQQSEPDTLAINRFARKKGEGKSNLVVHSEPPDAQVFLEGDLIGKTFLEASGLQEGLFKLEVKLQDYEPYQTKILLTSGEVTNLNITLQQAIGTLDLNTTPKDAKVEFIGKNIPKNQTEGQMNLAAGEYKIRFTHRNYLERIETIYVAPHTVSFRNIELEPKPSKEPTVKEPENSNGAIAAIIKSDSYPIFLTFFDGAHYLDLRPINENDQKFILMAKLWTYVLARSPNQEEILIPVELKRGKTIKIDFHFNSQPRDPRQGTNYGYKEKIYIDADLYPLRIKFFDAKETSEHTITMNNSATYISYPYRVFEAFGPNGEETKGLIDHKLVPLRIYINFKLSNAKRPIVENHRSEISFENTKETLRWIGVIGLLALTAWGGYELFQHMKDKPNPNIRSSSTSSSNGGVQIGRF